MGNNCCSLTKKPRNKIVLLLVGLDNAGKTVAAKGLAGERLNSPIPTVGFSVIDLKYSGYRVKVFDLGGGANIRGIWDKYFVDAHGVIFVIDSTDFVRFNEVKFVLHEMVHHEKVSGKPLLILANKHDQENALDEIDVIEYLQIENLVNNYRCPTLVQTCSATVSNSTKIDEGIQKGYEWIMNYIIREYQELNKRVENDVLEQELKERAEMAERIERIKAMKEAELKKIEDQDGIQPYDEYAKKLHKESCSNGKVSSNEVKPIRKLEKDMLVLPDGVISRQTSTSSSECSFPPVFYGNVNSEIYVERPKSATSVVHRHLRLTALDVNSAKIGSTQPKRNKTAPVNLYVPKEEKAHSAATQRRKNFVVSERRLKSADDRVFVLSGKVMQDEIGGAGDFHREMFQLNNLDVSQNNKVIRNGKIGAHGEVTTNVMSVVDID